MPTASDSGGGACGGRPGGEASKPDTGTIETHPQRTAHADKPVRAAGTYLSGIGGHRDARGDGFLVIEGDPEGGTVFDGARRFNDWRKIENIEGNVWERPWEFDWRTPPDARSPAPPIFCKRDMVFLDDKPIRMRITPKDDGTHPGRLGENEFSVSEEHKTIRVRLPEGVDAHQIERDVSVNNVGLNFNEANNIVLRNLTIRHSSFSHHSGPGMWMHRSRNVLVE